METEEFAEETRNDRLRVWPAVVILLLQVIVFGLSISSGINNGLRFGFMMFGPAAGVVLFATWLLVASRLRWRHRLMLATAMLAFPVAVAPLVHSSMKLGLFLYGGPVSMLISVVGVRLTEKARERRRLATIALGLVTVWGSFVLGRIDGFRSDYLPEFAWRWTPTAEQQLVNRRPSTALETTQEWQPVDVEWPGFRGPNWNGQAEWRGERLDWTTSEPREIWRIPVGPGWSSFAYASGRLFTQEQRGEDEAVSCYDAETGALVWMRTNKTRFFEIVSGAGPRATPRIADGRLYSLVVPLGDGVGVARLNFEIDETDNWQITETWTSNRLKPSFNDFVVHSGQVFGFDQNIFVSLNATTGERNWKRGRYGFGQVILLPTTDQMIVVTEQGNLVLVAADPERHLESGQFSALNDKTWNHPILVGNRLFVRSGSVAVCYEL